MPHRVEVSFTHWHADLTTVPISGGFWTNWIPNAIWQRWPVCWWFLNVIDHFSRRSMGFAAFKYRPTSEEVTFALDRMMAAEQVQPKHLIVDQGPEFNCEQFKDVWCKARSSHASNREHDGHVALRGRNRRSTLSALLAIS